MQEIDEFCTACTGGLTIEPLSDLQLFVAVAHARSFRGAAPRLGLSASSLSDAIRRLEGRLKTRLLNRTTRSVTLTDAGRRLFERVSPALGELTEALRSVSEDSDEVAGTLRLNTAVVVADTVLPDILARFHAAHPRIVVEVKAQNDLVDVIAAGYDAGIRYEERLERDMIAVPIGPAVQRSVLAAAPAYLARRGTPSHPRELVDHACIAYRFSYGVMAPWEFEKGDETIRMVPNGPLVTSSLNLLQHAAKNGLGLIFLFEDYLGAALESGALVPVLEDWWPSFSGPRLYYPSRTHNPPPLGAFLAFLRQERNANRR